MDDKGIILRTYDADGTARYSAFVFSRDADDKYEKYQSCGVPHKVDISSCTTVEEAVQAMATAINGTNLTNASASGKTLTLVSKNQSTVGNDSFLSTYTMYQRVPRASAETTGLISSANFSGGVSRRGIPGDPDSGYEDGTAATYTIRNVNAAATGSGFVIHGSTDIYIRLVEGMAPAALEGLEAATHAFVGGSKGHFKEILAALLKINPRMRVVANAVSLESISDIQTVIKDFPVKDFECLQISVSRSEKAGNYHLMKAENPVYIFSFDLDGGDKA
jgi:hypothetical protein